MPRHELELHAPLVFPINKDWRLRVKSDGQLLGSLEMSKGSIDWVPRGHKTTRFTMSWERFDEMMRDLGQKRSK